MSRMPVIGAVLYAVALDGVNAALGWSPVETSYLLISSFFMFFSLFAFEVAKIVHSRTSDRHPPGA
jgi:hypothetical protein